MGAARNGDVTAVRQDLDRLQVLRAAMVTANPTGGGIHAIWLLARVNGVMWSAVGSLNGGEISHKVNREVVLMVDDPVVHARLLEVFLHDWALVIR